MRENDHCFSSNVYVPIHFYIPNFFMYEIYFRYHISINLLLYAIIHNLSFYYELSSIKWGLVLLDFDIYTKKLIERYYVNQYSRGF
jgi:hypothetical protein